MLSGSLLILGASYIPFQCDCHGILSTEEADEVSLSLIHQELFAEVGHHICYGSNSGAVVELLMLAISSESDSHSGLHGPE